MGGGERGCRGEEEEGGVEGEDLVEDPKEGEQDY